MESLVFKHYNQKNLVSRIEQALEKAVPTGSTSLTLEKLAVIDQLHTGGFQASQSLFGSLDICPGHHVLDAGCGIGGTSRLMAREFSCTVTGLDLSDQFVAAARFLTDLTGFSETVGFHQGSILAMPFGDDGFDMAVCQHILMNIENKALAAKAFFRVLKSGGQIILHEVCKGGDEPVTFPVPWASAPETSFLESWPVIEGHFREAGFQVVRAENQTQAGGQWWEKVKNSSLKKRPSSPLNPGVIFGDNARFFGQNMAANFASGAVELFEAVLQKP